MSSCDFLSKLEIQRQAVSDFIHAFLMPLFSHIIYVIGTLKKKKKKNICYRAFWLQVIIVSPKHK